MLYLYGTANACEALQLPPDIKALNYTKEMIAEFCDRPAFQELFAELVGEKHTHICIRCESTQETADGLLYRLLVDYYRPGYHRTRPELIDSKTVVFIKATGD